MDVAFEKVASRLELVRNQIELTIENHSSFEKDIRKQEREFDGMNVYVRIPLARSDAKNDRALTESLHQDFKRAAEKNTGFRLHKITLAGPWNAARKTVPKALPFDTEYRVPDNQITDRRTIAFEVDFDTNVPADPGHWLREQQTLIRRLIEPVSWSRSGKRLKGRAYIYRYRDFEYPEMLAPDLSRYSTPGQASSPVQQTALKRIGEYRREIVALWPKCQPYLTNLRKFAVNDLRMNFFLAHAKLR